MVTWRCPVNPGSIACCTACETLFRKFDLKKCISIEIVFSGFFYLAYYIYPDGCVLFFWHLVGNKIVRG